MPLAQIEMEFIRLDGRLAAMGAQAQRELRLGAHRRAQAVEMQFRAVRLGVKVMFLNAKKELPCR